MRSAPLIAAVAIEEEARLATANPKDFKGMADLTN